MKQRHSTLNEMHETKKCNHHRKYEWKKYCKTKVDRTTDWISFTIIHLNSVMASSYTHTVTRHKLSISQQIDEKITLITRPSNTLIHADIPRADGQVVVGYSCFHVHHEKERQWERERAVTTGQQLLLTLKHYKGNKSSLYRSSCSTRNINPNI